MLQLRPGLTPSQREKIMDTGMELLANTGILFQDKKALSLLADFGGKIDRRDGRVRIPSAKILPLLGQHRPAWLHCQPHHFVEVAAGTAQHIWNFEENKKEKATVEHGSQIVALINHLPNIRVASCGARPADMDLADSDLWAAEQLLTYTRKPFRVETLSPHAAHHILQMAVLVAGSLNELQKTPLIHGCVTLEDALTYHAQDAELLRLYSQHRQPIHWTPYAYPLSCGVANVLSLQLAEWFATVYYLVCIENTAPVIWEMPVYAATGESSPQNQDIAHWLIQMSLAELAVAYEWPLSCALSTTKGKWGFNKGWQLGINRILPWHTGVLHAYRAGVVEDGFSVAQLVLENEVANYLEQVYNKPILAPFSLPEIAKYSSGYTGKALSSLWKSEIFRYDTSDLWRRSKSETVRVAKDYISQLWWQTEAEAVLSEQQRKAISEIKERAKTSAASHP